MEPSGTSAPLQAAPATSQAKPLIRLEGVSKTYHLGDVVVRALRGVSLVVDVGDFTAVMGSSGSGKSTLMNLVGCLDRPNEGRYWLGDQEVSQLSRQDLADVRLHTIGFVFQSFNLLNRTSAIENVELPLLYAGVSGRERRKRAKESLERVGLGDRLDHHSNQLSGGQQQRVAIARALVNRPKLLLADEPTGNLDSRTSVEVMKIFQELGKSGITVVLVTHEPDIATFASRVVVMKDGQVKSDQRQQPAIARPELIPSPDDEQSALPANYQPDASKQVP
jgi:putative ABC transport system ATP-binding protein